ncbi:hypothetical protein ACLJJ6_09495 [Pediococcus siamensis]|uniref:hypothetical protein n=1 Tax=Pediococcus siamensis TaxID=381829 RepID=UPI0039A314D2
MIIHRVNEAVIERFFKNDYQDRGMLKWGGFFLSDHTSAIQKMKRDQIPEKIRPQQTTRQVSQALEQAWLKKKTVHVQLKIFHQGETLVSLTGQVSGFQGDQIVFRTTEDQPKKVSLEEIRNVNVVEAPVDWHNFH